MRAPRLCKCGNRVAFGARCPCEQRQDAERKARFDKRRPSSSARGYDRTWERARAEYLREHRHCRRCGKLAHVVDHIRPHKGDQTLFWDRRNWQALCTACHSGSKQREERRGFGEGDLLGMAAFDAAGCRLFIGDSVPPDAQIAAADHDWSEVSRVETIGNSRAAGLVIVLRHDDLDVGQGILRCAATIGRTDRAFRFVLADGSERFFAARVVSAVDRSAYGRLRVVLAVTGEVGRITPMSLEREAC